MAKIISPDGTRSYIVRPGESVRDVKSRYPELKDTSFSVIASDGTWKTLKDNDIIPADSQTVQAVRSHVAGDNSLKSKGGDIPAL